MENETSIPVQAFRTTAKNEDILCQGLYFGVQRLFSKEHCFGRNQRPDCSAIHETESAWEKANLLHQAYFQRHNSHYDLKLFDRIRLIFIGTGGAYSLICNCARMGFGEYVFIDPDVTSESNIGTQGANPSAIGKKKVAALAEDIVKINPRAGVAAFPNVIEDFSDADFSALLKNPMRWEPCENSGAGTSFNRPIKPERTILLVLTDNFEAQARGHRLGLHFDIPTLCAQEYEEGIGAEITYTVSGVTPACHRCITASRYKAYLLEGYKNNVTSAGAPIFAAEFLNACLGHILLAVVHHGTEHPRWGKVIRVLGNRNLLRIRMDNSFDERFGNPVFGSRIEGVKNAGVFYFLDTLFLAQTPDYGQSESRPVCPDCGGTGDLAALKGQFSDTRIMLSR